MNEQSCASYKFKRKKKKEGRIKGNASRIVIDFEDDTLFKENKNQNTEFEEMIKAYSDLEDPNRKKETVTKARTLLRNWHLLITQNNPSTTKVDMKESPVWIMVEGTKTDKEGVQMVTRCEPHNVVMA
jgi:hypothetical protein